jgi:hypothetical protein
LDHVVECLEGSVKSFVHCSHLALRQMALAHNALAAILNLDIAPSVEKWRREPSISRLSDLRRVCHIRHVSVHKRASGDRSSPQRSFTFEMPQLIYSPWAKFCGKGDAPGAKEVRFTGKGARTEAGQPVVAATLIEPEGKQGKLFRVALPRPLQ